MTTEVEVPLTMDRAEDIAALFVEGLGSPEEAGILRALPEIVVQPWPIGGRQRVVAVLCEVVRILLRQGG